jgi:hypothetical protein
VNKPIAAFVLFALVAAAFSPAPIPALQGLLYYVATGFCLTLLIVTTRLSRTEANLVATVIGLSAVSLSMIGLIQIGLENQLGHASAPRMSSTLGSPVLLATYLVLGLPFLLTQLLHSSSREQRDFWVGCSTVALVGVFLTHTRMGLAALLVTVSVFLWKTRYRVVGIATLAVVILFGILVAGDRMRLTMPAVTADAARRGEAVHEVFSASPRELIFGVGSTRRVAMSPIAPDDRPWISRNMHLTLIRQNGLVGWGLMLWIVAAALVALYRGYDRIREPHMKRIVWAIFSSIVGLLLAMTDFNVFFNITIQIFFWAMVGVGIGIITHLNGRRPTFHVLWRFGEHGD